jgi:hypothetical protein
MTVDGRPTRIAPLPIAVGDERAEELLAPVYDRQLVGVSLIVGRHRGVAFTSRTLDVRPEVDPAPFPT